MRVFGWRWWQECFFKCIFRYRYFVFFVGVVYRINFRWRMRKPLYLELSRLCSRIKSRKWAMFFCLNWYYWSFLGLVFESMPSLFPKGAVIDSTDRTFYSCLPEKELRERKKLPISRPSDFGQNLGVLLFRKLDTFSFVKLFLSSVWLKEHSRILHAIGIRSEKIDQNRKNHTEMMA